MPNFSPTVATLAISGGSTSFIPPRFSPGVARLRIVGGSPSWTVGTDSREPLELDRLTRSDMLPGESNDQFMRRKVLWDTSMSEIEDFVNALAADVLEARLAAAEALAATAVTTATTAVETVNIANSYTDPTSVLTAANTGVITIAAHTRVYGDGSSVSVNSGSVSGFASGDQVSVYYQDAGRAGGAVTYYGTTDAVAQSGATHTLGIATIPAAGAASTTGTGVTAPGVPDGVYIIPKEYLSTQ